MVKGFILASLGLMLVALIWISLPRLQRRTCPVCQGTGYYEAESPIVVAVKGKVVARSRLLCPFCDAGRLSLYDLRERRPKILEWMVTRQKLPPELLVKRVKDAFGQEGLDELHANHFFMK